MFNALSSAQSITRSCVIGRRLFDGKEICVVDTPGFLDTSVIQEQIQAEIAKCYQLTAPGPHAFLLVINPTQRFTKEEGKPAEYLDIIFGHQAVHHTIIAFTHADAFLLKEITLEQYLAKLKPDAPLRILLDRFNHRYISVNNKGTQSEKDATVKKLLDMVSVLIKNNNGQEYVSNIPDTVTEEWD